MLTFLASYLPWILVAYLMWQLIRVVESNGPLRPFLNLFFAFVFSAVISLVIKHYFYFPRPSLDLAGNSFPSSHATIFMALAVVVWRYWPRVRWWYLIGAILIGLARVAIGWHWPMDVLFGWLLGLLIGACVIRLFRYNRRDHVAT